MKFTTKQRAKLPNCTLIAIAIYLFGDGAEGILVLIFFSLIKPVLVFILTMLFNKSCIISHFKIARSAGNFAVLHPTSLVKGL